MRAKQDMKIKHLNTSARAITASALVAVLNAVGATITPAKVEKK